MNYRSGGHRMCRSKLLRIRFFAAMGFRHGHAFEQDHLVVGSLTAACSNARA
jgi:hypothetical protein